MGKIRAHSRTKFCRLPPIVALLLLVSLVSAVGAAASGGSAAYQYLLGTGFFAGTNPPIPLAGPVVAMASDGSTVTLTGQGTLSVHPKAVTGSGDFTVMDSAGNVTASGTWTALDLLSLVSYGSGSAQAFPPQNFGGEALIRVQLSTGPTATLTAECLFGTPPAGKAEGIRLAVQGAPTSTSR